MPATPQRLGNKGADVFTFSIYLALMLIGWLMIYSVGAGPDGYGSLASATFLFETEAGKQLIWIGISLVAFMGVFFLFNHTTWSVFAYPIYLFTLTLLVLVLVFGAKINGATAWFRFGGFTFQPSELAKFGTCLAMAAYLNAWSNRMDSLRTIAVGFSLWLLPLFLIFLQPDAGSALVFLSFVLVMYREGLYPILYILGFFAAFMFVLGILFTPVALIASLGGGGLLVYALLAPRQKVLYTLAVLGALVLFIFFADKLEGTLPFWVFSAIVLGVFLVVSSYQLIRRRFRLVTIMLVAVGLGISIASGANYFFNNILQAHQQERLNVWLRPSLADPLGPRYNVMQSQLAIAAGGFTGKGLTQGTMTKFGYVPEQHTDFIFCTVGEEHGFVGTAAVILLFFALLWRLSILAERQVLTFNRAYMYGVAGILLVHMLVNIGMTMGLLPVIGIPLPFLSKGGSSLLGFTIMLAVALKLDKERDRM